MCIPIPFVGLVVLILINQLDLNFALALVEESENITNISSNLVGNCDQYSLYENGLCPISDDHILLKYRKSYSIPICVLVEGFGQKYYRANGIYCLTDIEETSYVSLQTLFSRLRYIIKPGKKKGSWSVYQVKQGISTSKRNLETPIYVVDERYRANNQKQVFEHGIPKEGWRAVIFVENKYITDDNEPYLSVKRLDLTTEVIKMIITIFGYHSGSFNICQTSTCYLENSSVNLVDVLEKELTTSYINEFVASVSESVGNNQESIQRLNDAIHNIDNVIRLQYDRATKLQRWRLSELRSALAITYFKLGDMDNANYYLDHSILISPEGHQRMRHYFDLGDLHLYMGNIKEAKLSLSKAKKAVKSKSGEDNLDYFNEYLIIGRGIGYFLTNVLSLDDSMAFSMTRSKVILACDKEESKVGIETPRWSITFLTNRDEITIGCNDVDDTSYYQDILDNYSKYSACNYLNVVPISVKMGWHLISGQIEIL